jgi:hypothetical protein
MCPHTTEKRAKNTAPVLSQFTEVTCLDTFLTICLSVRWSLDYCCRCFFSCGRKNKKEKKKERSAHEGSYPHSFSVTFLTLGLRPLLFCLKLKKKGGTDSTHKKKKDQRKAHEGFSYLLVVSAFLTPYIFSVTFFSLWPSPFFILLQNKQERKKIFLCSFQR